MAIITLKCTHCGKEIRGDDQHEVCFCMYCGHTVGMPRQVEDGTSTESYSKSADRMLLEKAYAQLSTDPTLPEYEPNIRQAEANFNQCLRSNRENHLAWMGLFICMLRLTENTFANQPKIEGTIYWLKPGVRHDAAFFQVESYFCRVVSRHGHENFIVIDDILQPGRKAKLYLDNAARFAPEEEKSAVEDIRFTYFGKPSEEMARFGVEELTRLAAPSSP